MSGMSMLGQVHEYERAVDRGIDVDSIEQAADATPIDFAGPLVRDGVPVLDPVEAIEFFGTRVPLRSFTVEGMLARAERRGLAVTHELRRDILAVLDAEIAAFLKSGRSADAFVREIPKILESFGLGEVNPHHLNTIIRTNAATAYQAGRDEMLDTPVLQEAFPWRLYLQVQDSAKRKEHEPMHGRIYHKDDPIWNEWTVPNGYNCRCRIVPLSDADLKAMGRRPSRTPPRLGKQVAHPDEGFRFNGPKAFREGADLKGFSAAAKRSVAELVES